MSYLQPFRPLVVLGKPKEDRTSTADRCTLAYYNHMLEKQEAKNEKIKRFNAELSRQMENEINALGMRSEERLIAVRRFEADAAMDRAWGKCVEELRYMAASSNSNSFRQYVQTRFRVDCFDAKREEMCCAELIRYCVADPDSANAINLSVEEYKNLVQIFGECSAKCGFRLELKPIVDLSSSIKEISAAVVKTAYTYDTEQHGGGSRNEDPDLQLSVLHDLLRHPTLRRLEVGNDEAVRESVRRIRQIEEELRSSLQQLKAESMAKAEQPQQQQQQQQQQQWRAAQEHNPPGAMVSAGSAESSSCLSAFPYIRSLANTHKWLDGVRQNAMQTALPPPLEAQLRTALADLKHSSLSRPNSQGTTASPSLEALDGVLTSLETLLHGVVQGGSHSFLRVLIALADAIVDEVKRITAESDVLMYAVIVCGIFRALSQKMRQQSSRVFSAILIRESDLCVPNLMFQSTVRGAGASGSADAVYSVATVRVGMLYAALVGHADDEKLTNAPSASPLSLAAGWVWLDRAGTQLLSMIALHSSANSDTSVGSSNSSSNSAVSEVRIATACRVIRTFLRLAGNALCIRFQNSFISLLGAIKQGLSLQGNVYAAATATVLSGPGAKKLLELLHAGCSMQYMAPLYYKGQAPFMLDAAALTRVVDRERAVVAAAEQDRRGPFMLRVKELQIDRLRAIFNKLSITVESQTTALNSLLQKILTASGESPDFLKYVLFKIGMNIVADCQEEFFNEMDEGHPLKLARVACGLCVEIEQLRDLLKAQFYKHCPLCIPKVPEAGLQGEDFLRDMSFVSKPAAGGSGGVSWEDKSTWLKRMSKLLCTFAVILIQPEQTPLTLADGWSWLAHVVNLHTAGSENSGSTQSGGSGSSSSSSSSSDNNGAGVSPPPPPFFTATALEVMLRVTAQTLHQAYGAPFLDLLVLIQTRLVPRMPADAPRKAELQTFLKLFIETNGQSFLSLFNKPIQ